MRREDEFSMTDPRILSIISTVFALLGAYNLYHGSRKMRDARRAGRPIRWHRQIYFMTGIEYLILTFVFLLSLASQQKTISPGMRGLVLPLYFILLLAAAIVAGIVINRGIANIRLARLQGSKPVKTVPDAPEIRRVNSKSTQQEELAQRQRSRRKKAAAARRRRTGKA